MPLAFDRDRQRSSMHLIRFGRGSTEAMRRPVYCVAVEPSHPPLALGMVVAHAAKSSAASRYRFEKTIHRSTRSVLEAIAADGPGVVLFSDYIWSTKQNLEISAELKRAAPECLLIHGGPDVPKDPGASDAFLRAHPAIDIAVEGEGERTFTEILLALDGTLDRARLREVSGLTYRDGERLVRTGPRDRTRELDELPSPYLDGFFDDQKHSQWRAAILETNRGCPYGCTFCDWGSATLQKIRNFGLERVESEIAWIAQRKIPIVFVADANFGILPRRRDREALGEREAEVRLPAADRRQLREERDRAGRGDHPSVGAESDDGPRDHLAAVDGSPNLGRG
jgi:radical SAM superfamily enzyme YgiQ (UPF0313 family)